MNKIQLNLFSGPKILHEIMLINTNECSNRLVTVINTININFITSKYIGHIHKIT